tara:strand:- start:2696 stop:2893 length:198 start_codon:yes stop_codon:yes gene_type:complete
VSSVIVFTLLIVSSLIFKAKWVKFLLIIALFSAVSVSITGHYGVNPGHIHGVGIEGMNLEMDHPH